MKYGVQSASICLSVCLCLYHYMRLHYMTYHHITFRHITVHYPDLPMSVFRAVVGVIVVLRRRGWQKTIEGGKTQTLVFVFGFFSALCVVVVFWWFFVCFFRVSGGSLSVFWFFYLVSGLPLGFGCLLFSFCLLLFGFVVVLFVFAAGMVNLKIASPGYTTKLNVQSHKWRRPCVYH